MREYVIARAVLATAAALFTSAILAAQTAPTNAPHAPLKTIGRAKTKVLPSLIVFNSRGASLQEGKLVLIGLSPTPLFSPTDPPGLPGMI
jgi:hypothetical protein